MPDYADYLIAEKYRTLAPDQRALVDEFLTYIEIESTYPAVDRRTLNTASFHYVGKDRRHKTRHWMNVVLGLYHPDHRNDTRVNLLLAISSTVVIAVTSITAQVQPVYWLLVPSWVFYSVGLVIYRGHRFSVSS